MLLVVSFRKRATFVEAHLPTVNQYVLYCCKDSTLSESSLLLADVVPAIQSFHDAKYWPVYIKQSYG